jgi:hypothetical protein
MPDQPDDLGRMHSSGPRGFRLNLKFMMALVAVASIGLGLFSRWYKSHEIMRRKISGAKVSAQREIMDLVWEPTDRALMRRAFRIDYSGPSITDATLTELSSQANPQVLGLDSSQVTDTGLVHLKGMSNLQFIDLGGTQITDAGLAHLKALAGLRGISLKKTQTTPSGLDELQRALPNAKIWRL